MRRRILAAFLAIDLIGASALASGAETSGRLQTRFQVIARCLMFRTERAVEVHAHVTGLTATLDIRFDRPLKTRFGIDKIRIRLRVRDASGREIRVIDGAIADGASGTTVEFDLPSAGTWAVVLEEHDLEAGPAKFRIEPGGRAVIRFDTALT